MDQEVSDVLARVGVCLSPRAAKVHVVPVIALQIQDDHGVLPLTDIIPIGTSDNHVIEVKVRALGELLTGNIQGFSSDRPPVDYADLLFMLMWTAVRYCYHAQVEIRDVEFSEIFNHLRRRPDGTHSNPIFSYLRAAVRVYASLVDLSKCQFESVMNYLRIAARRHADGHTSTAYLATMRTATDFELRTWGTLHSANGSDVEPYPQAPFCEFCT